MSIKAKLFAALAVLSAVVCILVTAGYATLTTIDAKIGSIVADRVVPLSQLKLVADQYAVLIVDNAHKVRAGMLSFPEGTANMQAAEQLIAEQWAAYQATSLTTDEATLVASANQVMAAAEPAMALLRTILQSGDMPGLETFIAEALYPAIDPISTDVSLLVDLQVNVARAEYAGAQTMFDLMNIAMVAVTVISAIAIGLATLVIVRTVSGRLSAMEKALVAVAEGNYTIDIPSAGDRDEIGHIARAAETFRQNGLKVAAMTEAEAAQSLAVAAERRSMMDALRDAFGSVVDASVAGDFTRRVAPNFPDAQLNELANGVNTLVANVDRGITETGEVLHALAQTDLTRRVEGQYDGAFDNLKNDVNAVADKLTDIVGQLRTTSGAVKGATVEILAGANDLADRTTRQAASIEETSAAMEQLSRTVVENAQRATSAAKNSSGVATSAEQTAVVMAEANTAMTRISDSSAKISSIIGMIDDIAFQTNLLALNASVEAARAGDAGKGFAVVAVEVRRLAQSAAQASSEVKVLVEQSASEVKAGSRFVSDAGARLQAMLTGIKDSASLIGDIASASQEQSAAISEVTQAIRQMDEMTQHNAALVEETNAAIEQTEAQASELDRIVDIFIIGQHSKGAPSISAPAQGIDPKGIRGLQAKAASARSLFTHGNAAVQQDWSEF